VKTARALTRWTLSLAAVLAIHAAAYSALQTMTAVAPVSSEEPIMVDLAPEPIAPPPQPVAQQEPEPEPPPPPPPPVPPEVVLPDPPPPPKPVRKVEKPVKRDQPPPAPTQTAEAAPANVPAPAAPAISPQQVSWQSKLGSYLQRFRRYPASAQQRGKEGVVLMQLTVLRDGTVASARIVQSSGAEDLDAAAVDWVARAAPLPRFTDDMAQTQVALTVPFRFTLR